MAQDPLEVKRRGMLKNLINEMIMEGIKITHASAEGYEFPYAIGRYRPDAIGVYPNGQAAVGVVRMGGRDIDSAAGRQQLKDLATRISQKTHKVIPLYIAIPTSASQELTRILKEVGLDRKENIRIRTY